MSERNVEYRVRAVTRYIVTAHDDTSTKEVGEFKAVELAAGAAAALAFAERENGANAVFIPYEGALPGKVMRCKVVLHGREQAVSLADWTKAKGNTEVRKNYQDRDYTWVDPADPANYVMDGERLRFGAVCPPTCDPNGAEENLIFGQYTPSFDLTTHVRNEGVLAALERGRAYYVDFTPAPQEVQ
jgi:hypothetical protein